MSWDRFNSQVRMFDVLMKLKLSWSYVHDVSGHGSPSLRVYTWEDRIRKYDS